MEIKIENEQPQNMCIIAKKSCMKYNHKYWTASTSTEMFETNDFYIIYSEKSVKQNDLKEKRT